MGAMRIAFARASARAGLLASIAAVVLLLTGLGTAVIDSLAGASVGGLRDGLTATTGVGGAARWQVRMSDDPEAQADAAASVLDRVVAPHGASWTRSVQTAPVDGDGGAFGAVLLADDGVPERSQLVSGSWPDAPSARAEAEAADARPTALHAAAAARLDLAEGDVVELDDGEGSRRLLVVGTWLPVDPNATAWFGEPIIATGSVEGGAGPFLVAEASLVDLRAATVVRWTALVDPAEMTPDRAVALRAALPNVEPALRNDPAVGGDGLTALGDLHATLDRLLAGLGAVRAIAPLPVLLLAFAGFTALDRLAALLGTSRRRETVLLRARGASARRLVRDAALEVLVVGVPAAVVGAAGAEAVLAITNPAEARGWPVAALVASVVLVGALAIVAGRAWRESTRPVVRGSGDEVGRLPRVAAAGGLVVVVAAAAVSLWQFRLYGSPLVATPAGTLEVDPVAVLAPVLVLLALGLAALAIARPVGAVFERGASQGTGLVPSLPMRQLARRWGLYASASLVTILAVSGLTLAAAFAGSWNSLDRHAAALATGGDVRIEFAGRTVVAGEDPLALVDPVTGLDEVLASGPVFRGEARIGSDPAMVVAAPASALDAISPGTGSGETARALEASRSAAAPELPAGADALEVQVDVTAPAGTPGTVAVSAWVTGAGGEASRLPGGTFDVAGGGGTARIELPDAPFLGLLGFEASLSGAQGVAEVTAGVRDIAVEGDAAAAGIPPIEVGGEVVLSSTDPSGRMPVAAASGATEPVPVVLGAELASRIRAEPGDPLAFRLLTGGAEVNAVVAAVAPAIPTAGSGGVLVDLGALSRATFDAGAGVPQYTERWVATDDPASVASGVERTRSTALAASTRADASSASLIAPAIRALWAGAVGALLFALIANAALVAALSRARFGEVVVLRVLGVAPGLQARVRFAELTAAIAAATVIGVVVGAVAGFATVRELARAAVADAPATLQVGVHVDWSPWLVALVAFLGVAAAIGAGAAASVRRSASRPGLREEER